MSTSINETVTNAFGALTGLTWRAQVELVLAVRYPLGKLFTLEQVTDAVRIAGVFDAHPGARTPEATLRRVLQEIRDDGALLFVDDEGTYVRIYCVEET